MTLEFQEFIKTGRPKIPFGTHIDVAIEEMSEYTISPINSNDDSYGIHTKGAEYLFYEKTLCLVQYESSRINKIILPGLILTKRTTISEFEEYLKKIEVNYSRHDTEDQLVIVTQQDVKIYFSKEEGYFQTALKMQWT